MTTPTTLTPDAHETAINVLHSADLGTWKPYGWVPGWLGRQDILSRIEDQRLDPPECGADWADDFSDLDPDDLGAAYDALLDADGFLT